MCLVHDLYLCFHFPVAHNIACYSRSLVRCQMISSLNFLQLSFGNAQLNHSGYEAITVQVKWRMQTGRDFLVGLRCLTVEFHFLIKHFVWSCRSSKLLWPYLIILLAALAVIYTATIHLIDVLLVPQCQWSPPHFSRIRLGCALTRSVWDWLCGDIVETYPMHFGWTMISILCYSIWRYRGREIRYLFQIDSIPSPIPEVNMLGKNRYPHFLAETGLCFAVWHWNEAHL